MAGPLSSPNGKYLAFQGHMSDSNVWMLENFERNSGVEQPCEIHRPANSRLLAWARKRAAKRVGRVEVSLNSFINRWSFDEVFGEPQPEAR